MREHQEKAEELRKVRAMKLPAFGGGHYVVFGGPYKMCPPHMYAFNLTEHWQDGDVAGETFHFPIQNYSVPTNADMRAALTVAVRRISRGGGVFIGCGWGRGRTGLFLACLAKAWGIKNPVAYTRSNYLSLAVETAEQQAFIRDLTIPLRLKFMVFLAKVQGLFGGEYLTEIRANL